MGREKIATIDEFETQGAVIKNVQGKEIAIYEIEGEYYGVLNYCPHQSGPLCEGELSGHIYVDEGEWEWQYDDTEKIVSCPWHHWEFDVTNGKNVQSDRYSVPTFDVTREGEELYVTV